MKEGILLSNFFLAYLLAKKNDMLNVRLGHLNGEKLKIWSMSVRNISLFNIFLTMKELKDNTSYEGTQRIISIL